MDWNSLIETDRQMLVALNGSESMFMDGLALTLTSAYTWIPLYIGLFYLVVKNNEKWKQTMLIVAACAFCILLASGLSECLVKPWVGRLRPSYEPSLSAVIDLVQGYRGTGFSFFSAHAANTMSVAVFFCLLVQNRTFSFYMLLWSVVNCWTRLYLGVHYVSDIFIGILWGVTAGVLVYFAYMYFYMKITPKLNYVSSKYTRTGYSLSDIDLVLNILSLTVVYTVIAAVVTAYR